MGPINLNFEIPMHNVSGLQIKGLSISQQGSDVPPPHKWIRYITKSTSYVCRVWEYLRYDPQISQLIPIK